MNVNNKVSKWGSSITSASIENGGVGDTFAFVMLVNTNQVFNTKQLYINKEFSFPPHFVAYHTIVPLQEYYFQVGGKTWLKWVFVGKI